MSKKSKKEKHESVGVDSEIQELFSDGEGESAEQEPIFFLPEQRNRSKLPIEVEPPNTPDDDKIDKDTEYVRNNIYELIEHGMAAIQDMSHLSREHTHPRTYEVFSKLMKEVAENNMSLLDIANKKKQAKRKEIGVPAPQVNNIDKAVFVGTTNDLLKAMEQPNGKVEKETV